MDTMLLFPPKLICSNIIPNGKVFGWSWGPLGSDQLIGWRPHQRN